MSIYQIKVVEPGAIKLLEDMVRRNLIKLTPLAPHARLNKFLSKMRSAGNAPGIEEITKEVESVRDKGHFA